MECEGGVEVWRGFVGFYWAGCRGVEGCGGGLLGFTGRGVEVWKGVWRVVEESFLRYFSRMFKINNVNIS